MQFLAAMLLGLLMMAGCANHGAQPITPTTTEKLAGYLAPGMILNSILLIPPPPSADSTAFMLDDEINRTNFLLRDSPRWNLAAQDAALSLPAAAESFSCALNSRITEQTAPHLYHLLHRTLVDLRSAFSSAKNSYKRPRPFMKNGERTCTPEAEQRLRKSGSYPSGHASVGWAWALILGEIAPERADAILARGRAFGQSRIVCNVHWQSDVDEGRIVGAAVVARLHADPAFRADMEAARNEYAALRANSIFPVRDCRAEGEALALAPPSLVRRNGN